MADIITLPRREPRKTRKTKVVGVRISNGDQFGMIFRDGNDFKLALSSALIEQFTKPRIVK